MDYLICHMIIWNYIMDYIYSQGWQSSVCNSTDGRTDGRNFRPRLVSSHDFWDERYFVRLFGRLQVELKYNQGWQSVGSIRFPDPGPTEISRTWSCSDLDIHFNGRIRIESSLQLLKYRSYCSVLYVYPEKVGRRIE